MECTFFRIAGKTRRQSVVLFFFCSSILATPPSTAQVHSTIRFAVIGDYGQAGGPESEVAAMVQSWNPDFVVTTGDNNYENGAASTIDQNVGQYFHQFISPYVGSYGKGDSVNCFFPCLGNHDWDPPYAQPYLDYFTLPGKERYYDFARGSVHFFCIDSDVHEPDGCTDSSVQAQWLGNALAQSTEPWKVVYFHQPPYTSGIFHGPTPYMQWPFQQWGATTVLSGHEHLYERLNINGLTFVVNGLGGMGIYSFGNSAPGSVFRYNGNYGAQLATANEDSIVFSFFTIAGSLVDRYAMRANTSDVRSSSTMPVEFVLKQNYPNPFNPSTNIGYTIASTKEQVAGSAKQVGMERVRLVVYDLLGREVAVLVDGIQTPGEHRIMFDARRLASGMYFYRLSAGGQIAVKRMVLVR